MIITVSAAGLPEHVQIEKSSGIAGLDNAAVEGAQAWRFIPAHLQGKPVPARVRVPVRFEIPAMYALDRVTGRPRDIHFEARRAGLAVAPSLDEAGDIPGFVPDMYPIGVESVAAGRALVERYGNREGDVSLGVLFSYTLRDEEGMSLWYIGIPPKYPPVVVRRRLVGNDVQSWYVTSILCEAQAETCKKFENSLRSSTQKKLPPLPVLPALNN